MDHAELGRFLLLVLLTEQARVAPTALVEGREEEGMERTDDGIGLPLQSLHVERLLLMVCQ